MEDRRSIVTISCDRVERYCIDWSRNRLCVRNGLSNRPCFRHLVWTLRTPRPLAESQIDADYDGDGDADETTVKSVLPVC